MYGSADELYFKPVRFGEAARHTFPWVDTFEVEIAHFVDCIEQNRPPIQSYVDGIRVPRIIRKSYDFVNGGKGLI